MTELERHTLKQWRKKRGLTQQKLAELADMSIGAVTDIEQQAVLNVGLVNMRKLCDALGEPGKPLLLDQVLWPTEATPRPAVSKRTQQRRLKKRQRQRQAAPESDEGSSSGEGGTGGTGGDGSEGNDPKSEALAAA